MKRSDAVRLRRKGEVTVRRQLHDEFCLYSDGTFVPAYPCTCSKERGFGYFNVWKGGKR